jgi:hypothetical protein
LQAAVVLILLCLQLAQGGTLETSLGSTPTTNDRVLSIQLYNYYIGVALMMFLGFGPRCATLRAPTFMSLVMVAWSSCEHHTRNAHASEEARREEPAS